MKIIKLDAGDVTIRPLTWKEKKTCLQMAEIADGRIKETVYIAQVEYTITDKDNEWLDSLSIEDGEKLRAAVIKFINPKKGDSKN